MARYVCYLGVLAAGLVGAAWGVSADDQQNPSTPPRKAPTKAAKENSLPAFTPEREAAAMTFVRQHSPELAELLPQLKEINPDEYQRAIRELYETSERLERTREKAPSRHEVELKRWQLNTRVQLLAARLGVTYDPAVESQLRAALLEQSEQRIAQMEHDRDRTSARLNEMTQAITKARSEQKTQIDREFEKLVPNPAKPADKAKAADKDSGKSGG